MSDVSEPLRHIGSAHDGEEILKEEKEEWKGLKSDDITPPPSPKQKQEDKEGGSKRRDSKEETEEEAHTMRSRPSFLDHSSSSSSSSSLPSSSSSSAPESMGARLLRLAGYAGAGGLGKSGTGIEEPIKAAGQMANEGIGFQGAVQRRTHTYESFSVEIHLKPVWLVPSPFSSSPSSLPSLSTIHSEGWMQLGPRDHTIITDDRYCRLSLQNELNECKSSFDSVPHAKYRTAREKSNPFESIKGEFFQNRAALKMAEMDAMCNRIFTQPPTTRPPPPPAKHKREIIAIGDICAGPGGFSEYMLTVLKWRAMVCGFTLVGGGAQDFNVSKFNSNAGAAAKCNFHAMYGKDGTGDITVSDNMRDYAAKVLVKTNGKGLDVIMADGGFSVVGRENLQEYLSRQLVLCQFLTALLTLRKGGVFVCKLFDTFLPFTVDLLWILRKHFTHFSLIKPNQSRPANSERYVVCHGLIQEKPPVVDYLFECNDKINELRATYSLQTMELVQTDFAANKENLARDKVLKSQREMEEARRAARLKATSKTEVKFVSTGIMNADELSEKKEKTEEKSGDGKIETKEILEVTTPVNTDIVAKSESDVPMADSVSETDLKHEVSDSSATAAVSSPATPSVPARVEYDLLRLVPSHLIDSDQEFVSYVTDCNETFGRRQISTLQRVKRYVEDPSLRPDDQAKVRLDCLEFWGLSQEESEYQIRMRAMERQRKKERETKRGRSRSRSRSRNRSRSRSRSRSRDRSPTPPPPVKRRYVHFDPQWQCKHFDPSFPRTPKLCTNAATAKLVSQLIPADIKQSLALLPLPNEQERMKYRIDAERSGIPLPACMVQLEQLARAARNWYIYLIPEGGVRHTVWFSQHSMGHIDEHGQATVWDMQLRVPADTILDVIWVNGVMHVLDAYSLPSVSDLHMYASRPKVLERSELIELFIQNCGEPCLKYVRPIALMDWKRNPDIAHMMETASHRPDKDIFLLKDGVRPPANISYSWNWNDDTHLTEVDELMCYIISKQIVTQAPMFAGARPVA